MIRRPSLRMRVAAAFAATTAVALVALGLFVYVQVEETLLDQTTASLRGQLDALGKIPEGSRAAATEALTDEMYGQLLDPDGRVLAGSRQVSGALVERSDVPDEGGEVQVVERRLRLANDDDETALAVIRMYDDQVLVVATSMDDMSETLQEVLSKLVIGGPLVLLVASTIGYLVAGVALRPVEQMRRQAELISDRRADERLPLPPTDDEISRLAVTLNAMLDRLETALARERRFVAEASHELRTPLALLRMELDLALSRPRSDEELLDAIRSANEEVERLTRLSEDLLLLDASTDGTSRGDSAVLDVAVILRAVADRFTTRAVSQAREIRVLCGEPQLLVRGNRDRLDRAVSNLVDNALLHGAGDVELSVRKEAGCARIDVTDHGATDAPLGPDMFQAFAAHPGARSGGGRGLGLAITRAIVEEHRGSVTLAPPSPGVGAVATIRLPLSETSTS
jgi:signal transduction histidine kinase